MRRRASLVRTRCADHWWTGSINSTEPRRRDTRVERMSSRVLTAVAWPYANGPRHIGHVSGFGVPSDVFSRYHRVAGDKVLMVSGTDEHRTPITVRTLPDRYIEGTCPICGYDGARGDQCDNCGNQLDPTDLINPVSKINGETPKFVESEHYFLDLPAFSRTLGDWLATRKSWRPNVLKFSMNLLGDLQPRAI